MKNLLKPITIKVLATAILALTTFLFWRMLYPHALGYQEQFQLFLFNGGYLAERAAVPGGLAAYVSEFLVQFYNSATLGSIVLAVLYALLQWLVWLLAKRNLCDGDSPWLAYVLSFVPSLMLWYAMGDENIMLAYTVSLIVTLGTMLMMPRNKAKGIIFTAIATPLLYWIVGPLVLAFAIFAGIKLAAKYSGRIGQVASVVAPLLYAVVCILISARFALYPQSRLFLGIFYYRLVDVIPDVFIAIAVVCILLAAIPVRVKITKAQSCIAVPAVALLTVVVATWVIPTAYDQRKYDVIAYDWLVRQQRWNDVIARSEKHSADLPMSVCSTNLALAMTGQLGDRCFDFFQNGAEGLVPNFENNFSTNMLTAEIHFMLGLVNTSQRLTMEAMEAIPNYNKSSRAIKRLAETNLINGQYQVAEKYLHILQQTLFYKKWAERRLEMIRNPKLIDKHPVYGYLRKVRLTNDFLFSDKEIDKICGQLVMHNKENIVAAQYLLMHPLLNRDINTFMNYYGFVRQETKYNSRVCEEAVALAYAQSNQLPQSEIQKYRNSSLWNYFFK